MEKVVHIDNSEKMRLMEEALEKEKKTMEKKYEADKQKIMA